VSKSVWVIAVMGVATVLLVSIAMVFSLAQFKEVPAGEWVKLAEAITSEFKAKSVSVRVNLSVPGVMRIAYLAGIDSNYNLDVQNKEMEKVARFAIQNYKGKDLTYIEEVRVTRSETHGSGCFQQTYVANFTLPVPRRATELRGPGGASFPPRDK
jgi:hypothetical protein